MYENDCFKILVFPTFSADNTYEIAPPVSEGLAPNEQTVHEMARDEARHGKAFAGLLKRYFGE